MGSIGEIDDSELKLKRFKGVTQGTVVGQGGLERAYDQYLRGVDGSTKITIDALGRPKSSAPGHDPVSGRSVRTTLDLGLQQTGEKYLDQTINQGPGTAGGFVALDPRDGSVLALGSYPTVNPSILSKPFSQATADRLFGDSGGAPLFNRAIGGSYPTGSTFKPITALAAMSTGVVQPGDVIDDHGCIKIGTAGQEACNAGKESLGPVNMTSALSKSSDVYFYTMGQRLNALAGQPLQKWARRMGLGHRTGIDTPGEFGGTVPDRAWRDRLNAEEAACRKKKHHPCGIADGTNRPWTEGDEVNLAVGQGDLQATPLQMAVAYSVLANGNHRVRPHLGAAVEDSGGRLLQRIEPGAAQHVTIDPAVRQVDPRRPARRHRPRHVGRRVEGLGPEPLPGVRQDRHGPAAQPSQRPVVVRVLRQRPPAPDRGRGHHRGRRLRRRRGRPGGAHDRLEVVPPADQVHRGQVEDVLIR